MKKRSANLAPSSVRTQWLAGLALAGVAVLLAVAPGLRRTLAARRRVNALRRSRAAQESWVAMRETLEARVRRQEDARDALAARMTHAGNAPALAQNIVELAQGTGCTVEAVRLAPQRPLPADPQPPDAGAGRAEPRSLEWPVTLELRGEFEAVLGLAARLQDGRRLLRATRIRLTPDESDGRVLQCTMELSAYGLRQQEGAACHE